MHHVARQVHVVVFQQQDVALELGHAAEVVDLLDELLPGPIGRMGLAREHDADLAAGVQEDPLEPLHVREEEHGSLVGCEAPGKPQRQDIRREQSVHLAMAGGRFAQAPQPVVHGSAGPVDHLLLEALMGGPDLGIRQVASLPQRRVVRMGSPGLADVAVEKVGHLGGHPGARVDAVGDRADRDLDLRQPRPDVLPKPPGDLAVELAHPVLVARELQGQHRQAEGAVGLVGALPQAHEVLAAHPQTSAQVPEVGLHELRSEGVVSGGDRGVGGEADAGSQGLDGLVPVQPALDHLAHQLQGQEGRVPFVHMPHLGLDAQPAQRAHAAQAQDLLLGDAHRAVTAVQLGREAAVLQGVLLDVGVQDVQPDPTDPDQPDPGVDGAVRHLDLDDHFLAVGVQGLLGGDVGKVESAVAGFLPPLAVDLLDEVSVVVQQAHADHRDSQIRGCLEVVAGKDAQAARVDGQALVHAEFSRKIGHHMVGVVRPGLGEAGGLRIHVDTELGHHLVVLAQPVGVGGGLLHVLLVQARQDLDGVVADLFPQLGVQGREERQRLRVPTPPEVP